MAISSLASSFCFAWLVYFGIVVSSMFNWTKELFIVRGLPGEGKSTLALKLVDGDRRRLVENDDYWFVPTQYTSEKMSYAAHQGPYLHQSHLDSFEYRYSRPLTHLAAQWCGAEAFRRLRLWDKVAVANVFARREHILGYLEEARKLQVRVSIHRPQTAWQGDIEQCHAKNIHGVPTDMLQKFKEQWEEMTQDEVDVWIGLPMDLQVARKKYNK